MGEGTINTNFQKVSASRGARSPADLIAQPRQKRSIDQLRVTLSMLCNFVWTRQLRPGEHLWTIPVDVDRDFDCILGDAIAELQELREALLAGVVASHPLKCAWCDAKWNSRDVLSTATCPIKKAGHYWVVDEPASDQGVVAPHPSENRQVTVTLSEADIEGLRGYIEWHGPAHQGDCPCDDTCACMCKSLNDAVNAICRKAFDAQVIAGPPQEPKL